MNGAMTEAWNSGQAYEWYAGRWSRKVATDFLRWLALSPGLSWADIGCGTGAVTSAILATCEPASVRGVDSSPSFVAQARQRLPDSRAFVETGDASRLPLESGACDVT